MFVAVELSQLFEVVWVSLVAGLALTTAYSLVVLGAARAAESRRGGQRAAAFAYAGLAAVGLLAFAALIVFGVEVMLAK
jgi:hypothetical protein